MAITTRNGKNPKPVAFNSKKKASAKKKKAPPAKHTTAPMIDPVKLAAERLRLIHIFPTATKHSVRHDQKCKKYVEEYIAALTGQEEALGPELLQLVPSPYGGMVPKLLFEMGGAASLDKRRIIGCTIFKWISTKPVERGDRAFHEPITVMQYIRTFLGHMKNLYDWNLTLDHDFDFEGGLSPSLTDLFQRRRQIDINYGAKSSPAVLKNAESTTELDIFGKKRGKPYFDTKDAMDLLMIMLLIHGCYLGFRGCKEHAKLMTANYVREDFERGHLWEGEEYYAIKNMEHKTEKLSASNPVLKSHNGMRIPVKSDPGQVIEYFLSVLSPGQERVYCRSATNGQKIQFAKIGHPNGAFSPNQPMGEHSINKLMKAALERIGHAGATGHALRRIFVTTLANDPAVSTEAGMEASRHTSVSAYRGYQVVGKTSEAAKFAALGIEKK